VLFRSQKVLFARAIRQRPRLLLLDEPTKGVDIGAKAEIYRLIRHLTQEQNITVIMVSSEEQEILRVADDVAIFRNGICEGTVYDAKELDESKLRALAWHVEESGIPLVKIEG
jgi:ribose transport system ATP-binding protein